MAALTWNREGTKDNVAQGDRMDITAFFGKDGLGHRMSTLAEDCRGGKMGALSKLDLVADPLLGFFPFPFIGGLVECLRVWGSASRVRMVQLA